MDGNKDDALKCLKIGKDALQAGDRTRALKFLFKARRLHPKLPVDDLLSAIEKDNVDRASEASPLKPCDKPSIRPRASSTVSATYTEDQITIVREIRRKKNYLEILGLDKRNSTVKDVRTVYRKLSLKVHPDKNKAPGAEEAFKAVSKAFRCLSNEESRHDDTPFYKRRAIRQRARRYHHHHHHHHRYYDADIGGLAPRRAEDSSSGSNLGILYQLLTVLLILLVQFLITSSDQIPMLSWSSKYTHRLTTPKGVNYYVKSSQFAQDHPPNSPQRKTIEQRVEIEYTSILAQNCRLELQRRQLRYIQETPYCDVLRKFDSVK